MPYTFHAYGHENILANHKNTLEFTKDKELSLDGDCIVGVGADFSKTALQKIVREHTMLRIRISAGGVSDELEFKANREFASDREVVLRFSEFSSERTLGFRATKSAMMLDRKLVGLMRKNGQKINVTIEPMVKAFIFDFDDTIEDYQTAKNRMVRRIAKRLFERYGVYEPTSKAILDELDNEYSHKGMHGSPANYDRHTWFKEYFRMVGIKATEEEIDQLVDLHWRYVIEDVKALPNAQMVLASLHKDFKIGVMSDSDGTKEIKMHRVKATGLEGVYDVLMTSDDVGMNKPNKKFYSMMLDKLGVRAEECVMVGDKPQVDLELAKELGMKTVWMKHGDWAMRQDKRFDYVDHEITDLRDLLKIAKEL